MRVLQGGKIKDMELSEIVEAWFAGTLLNDVAIPYTDFEAFKNIVDEMVAKGWEMPCDDPDCETNDCHTVYAEKTETVVDGVLREGEWSWDGTAWRESKLLAELASW